MSNYLVFLEAKLGVDAPALMVYAVRAEGQDAHLDAQIRRNKCRRSEDPEPSRAPYRRKRDIGYTQHFLRPTAQKAVSGCMISTEANMAARMVQKSPMPKVAKICVRSAYMPSTARTWRKATGA